MGWLQRTCGRYRAVDYACPRKDTTILALNDLNGNGPIGRPNKGTVILIRE